MHVRAQRKDASYKVWDPVDVRVIPLQLDPCLLIAPAWAQRLRNKINNVSKEAESFGILVTHL